MSLTVNAKSYLFDSSSGANNAVYTGPLKSMVAKDDITLARTAPKPTTENPGVARTKLTLVRSFTIAGVVRDAHVWFETSLPVGIAVADAEAMFDDIAAWLATAAASDFVQKHKINQ